MKKIILTALILFVLSSVCFAEKQEWVDKSYNFSKVKTVFIYDPVIPNEIKNGIAENEINEIFNKKKVLKDVKILDIPQVVILVQADTGINLDELYKTDPQGSLKMLFENIHKYADIVIVSKIQRYGTGSEYKEAYSYNTTTYQTSTVTTSNGGFATIDTPVTQTNTVPGGYFPASYVTVRYDVYDTKTNKQIFSRIDERGKVNRTAFDNTKPRDMFGRIVGSFFDDFNDLLNREK